MIRQIVNEVLASLDPSAAPAKTLSAALVDVGQSEPRCGEATYLSINGGLVMPAETIIVLACVIAAFAFFAGALLYGDFITSKRD